MRDTDKPAALKNLDARLKKARREREEQRAGQPGRLRIEAGRYGAAWRLSVELVAGLLVGGGFGWLLDYWLGTRPWLFLVFFLLGFGAGLRGVFRVARQINAPPDEGDKTGNDARGGNSQ